MDARALWTVVLGAPLFAGLALSGAQNTQGQNPARANESQPPARKSYSPALIESGNELFQQNCSFCHGRDAGGGESGPDLTRSKLVKEDVDGDKIGSVVRNGRPEKGMPRFDFSDEQIVSLTAFIHAQQNKVLARKGGARALRFPIFKLETSRQESGISTDRVGALHATRPQEISPESHRVTRDLSLRSECYIPKARNPKSL